MKEPPIELLERIAAEELDLPSLKASRQDDRDFFSVALWDVKEALVRAYKAGYFAAVDAIPPPDPYARKGQ
jgi:hypothetical protein